MISTSQTTVARTARLNPGRQWVRINHVEFPLEVQPRAGIDMEWVRQLSEFRKEGSEFPPIKVFQTPDGRLIGAEGHHRSLAMLKADEESILCDVVDGTLEDAVVFAAGSNRSNGIKPMGPKDITKAVEMLLALDEWWEKSSTAIGAHVGCSRNKASNVRARVAAERGRPLPQFVEDGCGRIRRRVKSIPRYASEAPIRMSRDGRRMRYRATWEGEEFSGATRESVREKLAAAEARERARLVVGRMRRFLEERGFASPFGPGSPPGMNSVRHLPGFLCVPTRFEDPRDLPAAVGQLVAARRLKEPGARTVVLCYPDEGPAKLIDLYRQEGFEFLAPEELEAALAACEG